MYILNWKLFIHGIQKPPDARTTQEQQKTTHNTRTTREQQRTKHNTRTPQDQPSELKKTISCSPYLKKWNYPIIYVVSSYTVIPGNIW